MTKKKGKKKAGRALSSETTAAVEGLLEELKSHEAMGEPLEISLQQIQSHLNASPEKDMAIVSAMGAISNERTAKLLLALSQSVSDKRVIKGIRRSLYRIEQKGISVEAVQAEKHERSVLRPPAEDESHGFISAVDSEGSQIVILTVSRKPKGLYLLQGIVSDTRGLIEFNRVETTKRGFRDFYQSMRQPGQFAIVEADVSHCRFLLEQAARLTEGQGKSPPAAYFSSKRELDKIEPVDSPPVFVLLNEKEIQGDARLLKKSSELFQSEPFSSWFLPPEQVEKYAQLIEDAEESRLVLNPAQKEERLQETYRKALVEIFTDERRRLYRRRLEEMAYVLMKEGDEESARLALAASIDLRSARMALEIEPNPFLLNLVTRSIYVIVARDMEKKETEPSLIVKP